ncbi:MAG: hypothetical protein HQL30_10780 [Candidatus Omnitrophica bacterium]|nr:hypothetical protein [Candidatus Omnitrophota bacterium]
MIKKTITALTLFFFSVSSVPITFSEEFGRGKVFLPRTMVSKSFSLEELIIPASLGEIKTSMKGNNTKTIIHIQDAHCNYAAQNAIAGIIGHIVTNYGDIDQISLEGGKGSYDLSLFTSINSPDLRRKVSDYFVREGRMTGPEFYAINNPLKVELFGIEDEALYEKNLNAYLSSHSNNEKIEKSLAEIDAALTAMKGKFYGAELAVFDDKVRSYKDGSIEFKEYILYLGAIAAHLGIDLAGHKNVEILLGTLVDEKAIDFGKAEKERSVLVDKIGEKASKNDIAELAEKTALFRSGEIEKTVFYGYLFKKAAFSGVDLATFPDLAKYSAYLEKYEGIDKNLIMRDMKAVEAAVYENLAVNDDERALIGLYRDLSIIKGMFSISLVKEDFDDYMSRRDDFMADRFIDFVNNKAPLHGLSVSIDGSIGHLDGDRARIEEFFTCSVERDDAFVANIADRLDSRGKKVTILVTGGFHTANLSELFRKEGYSYVGIMPKFKTGNMPSPYQSLLSGENNGIESLMAQGIRAAIGGSNLAIKSLFSEMGFYDIKAVNELGLEVDIITKLFADSPGAKEGYWLRLTNGAAILITKNDIPEGADAVFGSGEWKAGVFVNALPAGVTYEDVKAVLVDGDAMTWEQQEVWIDTVGKKVGAHRFGEGKGEDIKSLELALSGLGISDDDINFILKENIRVWDSSLGLGIEGHPGADAIYVNPEALPDRARFARIIVHEVGAAYGLSHAENVSLAPKDIIAKARAKGIRLGQGSDRDHRMDRDDYDEYQRRSDEEFEAGQRKRDSERLQVRNNLTHKNMENKQREAETGARVVLQTGLSQSAPSDEFEVLSHPEDKGKEVRYYTGRRAAELAREYFLTGMVSTWIDIDDLGVNAGRFRPSMKFWEYTTEYEDGVASVKLVKKSEAFDELVKALSDKTMALAITEYGVKLYKRTGDFVVCERPAETGVDKGLFNGRRERDEAFRMDKDWIKKRIHERILSTTGAGDIASWKKADSVRYEEIEERIESVMSLGDNFADYFKMLSSQDRFIDKNDAEYDDIYGETRGILDRLLAAEGYDPSEFSLELLDTDMPKAYVMRYTNRVFVSRGLINWVLEKENSKNAVAFVLAHEIRHVAQWVDDIIEGRPVSMVDDHPNEYDADNALAMVDSAGFSVRNALLFFEILEENKDSDVFLAWSKTHPQTLDRIRKLRPAINDIFWSNYFKDDEAFSENAAAQAKRSGRHRKFQEDLVNGTPAPGAERARSIEEYIASLYTNNIGRPVYGAPKQKLSNIASGAWNYAGKDPVREVAYGIFLAFVEDDINAKTFQDGLAGAGMGSRALVNTPVGNKLKEMSFEDLISVLSVDLPFPLSFTGNKNTKKENWKYLAPTDYSSFIAWFHYNVVDPALLRDVSPSIGKLLDFLDNYKRFLSQAESCSEGKINSKAVIDSLAQKYMIAIRILMDAERGAIKNGEKKACLERILSGLEWLNEHDSSTGLKETLNGGAAKALFDYACNNKDPEISDALRSWLSRGVMSAKREMSPEEKLKKKFGLISTGRNGIKDGFFAILLQTYESNPGDIQLLFQAEEASGEGDLRELLKNAYFARHVFPEKPVEWLKAISGKYGLDEDGYFNLMEIGLESLKQLPLTETLKRSYRGIAEDVLALSSKELDKAADIIAKDGEAGAFWKRMAFLLVRGVIPEENRLFELVQKMSPEKDGPQAKFLVSLMKTPEMRSSIVPRFDSEDDAGREEAWDRYVLLVSLYASYDKAVAHALVKDGKGDSTKTYCFGRFLDPGNVQTEYDEVTTGGKRTARVGPTTNTQMVMEFFGEYLKEKTVEDIVNDMPASPFRNFTLYAFIIESVFREKLKMKLGLKDYFDLVKIQGAIAKLDEPGRAEVIKAVAEIAPLLAWDKDAERANISWLEPAINEIVRAFTQEKSVYFADYEETHASYTQIEYAELGGPLSQMDAFVPLLLSRHIENVMGSSSPAGEKLGTVLKIMPHDSAYRDRYLVDILDKYSGELEIGALEDIVLARIKNPLLREKYAVMILEKRQAKSPEDFKTLDGWLGWVGKYLPEFSYTRDDLLLNIPVKNPEEMKEVKKLLLNAPENIRHKAQAKKTFYLDAFGSYLSTFDAKSKAELLLWFFKMSPSKPSLFVNFESRYQVNLNGLRDAFTGLETEHYKNIGISARREFLGTLLSGENGVLSDDKALDGMVKAIFAKVCPNDGGVEKNARKALEAVFTSTFRNADNSRREGLFLALVSNMSRIDSEKVTDTVTQQAMYFRAFFESLGLVGIKLGQFISSMEGVPVKLREELGKLKDKAPPIPRSVVFDMIEKIYVKFENKFSELGPLLGSGSIKCVFKVKLDTGEEKVLKIKRPDIDKRIGADLAFLETVLGEVGSDLNAIGIQLPRNIVKRISAIVNDELDFDLEARNQDRVSKNLALANSGKDIRNQLFAEAAKTLVGTEIKIKFDTPVAGEVADKKMKQKSLMIEDMASGIPLSKPDKVRAAGMDPDLIKEAVGVELLRQMVVDNFYHADPHVGNIFVELKDGVVHCHIIDLGAAAETDLATLGELANLIRLIRGDDKQGIVGWAERFMPDLDKDALGKLLSGIDLKAGSTIQRLLKVFQTFDRVDVALPDKLMSLFRLIGAAGDILDSVIERLAGNFGDIMREAVPAEVHETAPLIGIDEEKPAKKVEEKKKKVRLTEAVISVDGEFMAIADDICAKLRELLKNKTYAALISKAIGLPIESETFDGILSALRSIREGMEKDNARSIEIKVLLNTEEESEVYEKTVGLINAMRSILDSNDLKSMPSVLKAAAALLPKAAFLQDKEKRAAMMGLIARAEVEVMKQVGKYLPGAEEEARTKQLERGGVEYGRYDPRTDEITIDVASAKKVVALIAPGLDTRKDRHKVTGFVHAHELLHQILGKQRIKYPKRLEEYLADAFAKRSLGMELTRLERTTLLLIRMHLWTVSKQAARQFSISYESPEFLVNLHRLGIDPVVTLKGEALDKTKIPVGKPLAVRRTPAPALAVPAISDERSLGTLKDLTGSLYATGAAYIRPGGGAAINAKTLVDLLKNDEETIAVLAKQVALIKPWLNLNSIDRMVSEMMSTFKTLGGNNPERIFLYVTEGGDIKGMFRMSSTNRSGNLSQLGVMNDEKGKGIGTFLMDVFFTEIFAGGLSEATIPAENGSTSFYIDYLRKLGIAEASYGEQGISLKRAYDRRDWDNFTVPVASVYGRISSRGSARSRAISRNAPAMAAVPRPQVTFGDVVNCQAGGTLTPEGAGAENMIETIKRDMKELGGVIDKALQGKLFDGRTECDAYVVGLEPTGIEDETLRSLKTGVRSAMDSFLAKRGLRNVMMRFGLGIDDAKKMILEALNKGDVKAVYRTRFTIGTAALDAIAGIMAANSRDDGVFIAELKSFNITDLATLKEELGKRTMLNIITNDVQDGPEGEKLQVALPYGRLAIEALMKFNLADYIESSKRAGVTAEKMMTDESYRGVFYAWAKSVGVVTNNPLVAQDLMELARKTDPDLFISKTFQIELPPINKIDFNVITECFKAETEVVRSL